MNVTAPAAIKLSAEEQDLVRRIDFTPNTFSPDFHRTLEESCAAAGPLMKSLLKRQAIPPVRWDYFIDPERNIGSKRSHKGIFEGNGTRGDQIFEHGHFLPYLKYFIFGPDLPLSTIAGFCAIANDSLLTTHMQLDQLRAYVRREVRQQGLDRRHAAEEFYNLAYECDLERFARSVREAALQARSR